MARTLNPYVECPALMYAEVRRASRLGRNITDDCARAVACEWNRGQVDARFRFAATGEFDGDSLLREIEAELARPDIHCLHSRAEVAALNALRAYVRARAHA